MNEHHLNFVCPECGSMEWDVPDGGEKEYYCEDCHWEGDDLMRAEEFKNKKRKKLIDKVLNDR